MISENFLNYKSWRWFWISLVTFLFFLSWYLMDDTPGVPNGGTLFGISSGIAAAGIMVFLMWYAKRKRSYFSRVGTLKGWLSAHVWLGLLLIVLVPLHSGFQFGFSVHGLTYFFLIAVVLTGIWGIYAFIKYPSLIDSHRGGGSAKLLKEELTLVERQIENELGQSTDSVLRVLKKYDVAVPQSYWALLLASAPAELQSSEGAKDFSKMNEQEQQSAERLLSLVNKKRSLITKMRKEARLFFALQCWLYIHLPLASILMVLLVLHIGIVLLMW
jgi:hypothetical protein